MAYRCPSPGWRFVNMEPDLRALQYLFFARDLLMDCMFLDGRVLKSTRDGSPAELQQEYTRGKGSYVASLVLACFVVSWFLGSGQILSWLREASANTRSWQRSRRYIWCGSFHPILSKASLRPPRPWNPGCRMEVSRVSFCAEAGSLDVCPSRHSKNFPQSHEYSAGVGTSH